MKKFNVIWLMVLVLIISIIGFGCTETDADRVSAKIAAVHDTVKAVITDDAVISQIPDDTWEKLVDLEDKYQLACKNYEASKSASSGGDWSILKEMVSYGSALVSIIKDLPCVSKYSGEIAVTQATITALVNLFS